MRAQTDAGTFVIAQAQARNENQFVLLRPRAVERIVEKTERAENVLRGKIVETLWRGGHQWFAIETRAGNFLFEWDGIVKLGQEIFLQVKESEIQFLRGGNQ